MNTTYDLNESEILIAKLLGLTRDGKIEWTQDKLRVSIIDESTIRYRAELEGILEVVIWSSSKAAGFRLIEKLAQSSEAPSSPGTPGILGRIPQMPVIRGSSSISERDLIAISIDHEEGPSRGELYVNLMSLLELARRFADKIEPKVDRVKQYLDKLAV